uniref:Transposase Tc1-like domain-containing protein n=1 Tax=Oncorhynchus tshawytscha TaxID=74940 RepID=A0AAZ3P4Z4_ONCTS
MVTTTARVTPGMHNPSISAQTVRNRLREAGLSACRPVVRQVLTRHHQQQHCLWAQTHHRWTRQDWQKVLFTDESRFFLTRDDGRICVYRQRNACYTEACTLERGRFGGGGSIMVWGSVSQHRRTELVVITSPSLILLVLCMISCKTGMSVKSPDLNPIEHVWDLLDRRVRARTFPPRNVWDLAGALVDEWGKISQQELENLAQFMRRRCTAVHNAAGGHTRY